MSGGHTRWEHLVLEQSTMSGPFIADHYGGEGWELVAAIRVTETVDRLWFKRPIGGGPEKPRDVPIVRSVPQSSPSREEP